MPRKHVNVCFISYNSLSSYISDQWLKHRKIFKKKKLQVGDLLNWQDDSQQFYIPKNCKLARNVSSIELEKLLYSDSSSFCAKKRNEHSDSAECVPNTLKYSRVFMHTCQNKGCMCKPIIQGRPRCQISDEIQVTTEKEKPIIRKDEEIQTAQSQTRIYPDESFELVQLESQEEILEPKEILEPNKILEPKKVLQPKKIMEPKKVLQPKKIMEPKKVLEPNESFELIQLESQEEILEPKKVLQPKKIMEPKKVLQPKKILEPKKVLEPKKILEANTNGSDKEIQTVDEKPKYIEAESNIIRYEMCQKNPCDPCPDDIQYCVPHNVEQLIKDSSDKEIQFIQCANKELCTCEKYDTEEGLKRGLRKLPGKNICIQNKPELVEKESIMEDEAPMEELEPERESERESEREPEREPEPKQIPEKEEIPDKEKNARRKAEPCCVQSSSSGGCCCFKKKKKRGCERYIQACRCCSNKACQPEPRCALFCTDKETCVNDCVTPNCENVKSIWICSRCGKVYNNSCKRCDRSSCTKNTIILPPTATPGYCNNQTDILKTLITMEAKQNFRQIDNILLELNQQRTELRKLNDMYRYIAGKPRNNVSPNESFENTIDNAPKVYICEGCEIDVNRNILRTIMSRADKKQHDEYEKEWEESVEVPDNDKYIKNIINKRKRRPSNGSNGRKLRIKTLEDDGSQTSEDNKNHEDGGNTKLKGKNQTFESTGTDAMAVVGQVQTDNQINVDAQADKPDHLTKDEMESEKVFVNEFSNTDLEQQPDDRTFMGWCKKSLTSLRQCRSRELLKRFKRKISECKKSCTESSEAQSEDKLKCNYQYFQNKLDKCKSSLSNMRQQCKEQQVYDYQCRHENMGDCKQSLTNMGDRYNVQKEKCNEYLQNKITQCREKAKENKEKRDIMNYCK